MQIQLEKKKLCVLRQCTYLIQVHVYIIMCVRLKNKIKLLHKQKALPSFQYF